MKQEQMIEEITNWLNEAAQMVHNGLKQHLTIQHKTSRKDLVTNMDKEIQAFLIQKIQQQYPAVKTLFGSA